jgi:hypothetical protein
MPSDRTAAPDWRRIPGSFIERLLQLSEDQPPDQAREHAHRQEEMRAAANPVRAIEKEAAARHHAVDMGMEQQVLASRVQDRDAAGFGAQVFRIGGDGVQGFGAGGACQEFCVWRGQA